MTCRPEELSDDALIVALAIAHARRAESGCLGVRTELAALEAEQQRRVEVRDGLRDLERMLEEAGR